MGSSPAAWAILTFTFAFAPALTEASENSTVGAKVALATAGVRSPATKVTAPAHNNALRILITYLHFFVGGHARRDSSPQTFTRASRYMPPGSTLVCVFVHRCYL